MMSNPQPIYGLDTNYALTVLWQCQVNQIGNPKNVIYNKPTETHNGKW